MPNRVAPSEGAQVVTGHSVGRCFHLRSCVCAATASGHPGRVSVPGTDRTRTSISRLSPFPSHLTPLHPPSSIPFPPAYIILTAVVDLAAVAAAVIFLSLLLQPLCWRRNTTSTTSSNTRTIGGYGQRRTSSRVPGTGHREILALRPALPAPHLHTSHWWSSGPLVVDSW